MICQHGHNFDEEALRKDGVPDLVINEARTHHELGVCVQINTDQMVQDLMKVAREIQPDRFKPRA